MPNYREIYSSRAVEYEQLIAREDYESNILPALLQIRPLRGLDVVELGAGTGRLARLLAPISHRVLLLDASAHMLGIARQKLRGLGLRNWKVAVSDNRSLAIKNEVADIVIAGWSLGHFTGWYPSSWRWEIGRALTEMRRVLRPDGTLIILETQGTGQERPAPPTSDLSAYYDWLERYHGFSSTWIRTDYRFRSISEANNLLSFFFGDEMARRVIRPHTLTVPECTGIWWLTGKWTG